MLGFGFDAEGRFRHDQRPATRNGTMRRLKAEIDVVRQDARRTVIEVDEMRLGTQFFRPVDLAGKPDEWLAARLRTMICNATVRSGDDIPRAPSRRSILPKGRAGVDALTCSIRRTFDEAVSFQIKDVPEQPALWAKALMGPIEVLEQDSLFFLEQRMLVLRALRSDRAAPLLEDPATLPRLPRRARDHIDLLDLLPEEGLGVVVGPPGTGKTQAISDMALHLQKQGKSCLLLAWTKIAVEEALGRTIQRGGRAFRLGRSDDPEIPSAPWDDDPDWLEVAEGQGLPMFGDRTQDPALLGATFLQAFVRHNAEYTLDDGVGDDRFDVVLVDEASQAPFEAVLFAMRAGKKVILLGDPIQLPPVYKAEDRLDRMTRKEAPDCLSAILAERPDLYVLLRTQYRSLPGIMDWSNHSFYGGMLRNGRADDGISLRWPRSDLPRVKLVTVPGAGPSNRNNPATLAKSKAVLTSAAKQLRAAGLPERALYITPYREQADEARIKLDRVGAIHMTIGTVDASQGKQAPIVVFDLCTAKETAFWDTPTMARRFNVAMTRATHHVVIIAPEDLVAGARIPWLRSLLDATAR